MNCGYCDGEGEYKGMDGKMHKCGKCNGTGEATVDQVVNFAKSDKTGGYCPLHGPYEGESCPHPSHR